MKRGPELSVARADLEAAVEGRVFHQIDAVGILVADVHVLDDAVGPVIDRAGMGGSDSIINILNLADAIGGVIAGEDSAAGWVDETGEVAS